MIQYLEIKLYFIITSILPTMGASCCAKPTGGDQSPPSSLHEHENGHRHDHSDHEHNTHDDNSHTHDNQEHNTHEHGGCCDDTPSDDGGGCCGDSHSDASSIMSEASTCCGSEERCDGKSMLSYITVNETIASKAP